MRGATSSRAHDRRAAAPLAMRSVLSSLFGRSPDAAAAAPQRGHAEGGLYALPRDGAYGILKILKRDAHGVHVRCYSNVFAAPPAAVDEAALYMAGIDRRADEPLGMGHLPVSHASFERWDAVFVQVSAVEAGELEGYEAWRDAEGGYF